MLEQLTALFRDEHIVAIDKPPGLLVHRFMLFALNNELAGAHGLAIRGRYGGTSYWATIRRMPTPSIIH